MQEEVEKKSIHLAVRVAGATLKVAFRELMKQKDKLKAGLKEKANAEPESPTGKQSVKELIGQGQGVSSMDLESGGLREFNKIAKKLHYVQKKCTVQVHFLSFLFCSRCRCLIKF